ncbi:MAG: hypothetical protein WBV60_14075 [Terriglobales bacterium]
MERKIVAGVEEIEAVQLRCATDGCNERVTFLNTEAVQFSCGHGGQVQKIDGSLGTFVLALARPQAMQEQARKAGFSVLLEFSEPVK